MSIDDIGDVKPGQLYTKDGKDVWEVASYFDRPSLTLKNIRTGETETGGVGCLNFKPFKKLVPVNKASNEKEIPMPGGFPVGTKLVEIKYGAYEVVIPLDDNIYVGSTMEEALQVARDRSR